MEYQKEQSSAMYVYSNSCSCAGTERSLVVWRCLA